MNTKILNILKLHFGVTQGQEIYDQACTYYEKLKPMTEGESKDRQKNMLTNIFPFIAIYKILLRHDMTKYEAMNHMFKITEIYTRTRMRKTYEKAGKLPFFFPLFKKMFSIGLKGNSWDVEWVSNNKETFEYNITKCLWHDTCKKAGCPELCKIFCHNDEINFIDVSPRLFFKRSMTIGNGDPYCDFHFYRHDPDQ